MSARLAKELLGFLSTHTLALPIERPTLSPDKPESLSSPALEVKQAARLVANFIARPATVDRTLIWSAVHLIPSYFRPRPKTVMASATIEDYRLKAENFLEGAKTPAKRNAAITGAYAALFSKKPSLFPWCGLAAFASRQVGYGIQFTYLPQWPWNRETANSKSGLLGDLFSPPINACEEARLNELLRRGNDGVFRHIFPVLNTGPIFRVSSQTAMSPSLKTAGNGFRMAYCLCGRRCSMRI